MYIGLLLHQHCIDDSLRLCAWPSLKPKCIWAFKFSSNNSDNKRLTTQVFYESSHFQGDIAQ